MKAREFAKLEQALGHRFRHKNLLEQALTHTSYAREMEQSSEEGTIVSDNEQLEFLGDAVLELVTSEKLFQTFPQFREGELSKFRAYLVSEQHLIQAAKKLRIGKYLRLGRGEEKSGGREKVTLQVDALEALLAAMYLDCGMEKTRTFIFAKVLGPEIRKLTRKKNAVLPVTDYKSALQEKAHQLGLPHPRYNVVHEHGPQHNKTFTIEVRIPHSGNGRADFTSQAEGTTKKQGEQAAAKLALEYLKEHWKSGTRSLF
ncbi:MAG TPA: ribonuclease III [Terriglobales bacterium]|nr:ribonuclease III [Terriglobales bacterium]